MKKQYVVVEDSSFTDPWSGEYHRKVRVVAGPCDMLTADQKARDYQYDADYDGRRRSYHVREAVVGFA